MQRANAERGAETQLTILFSDFYKRFNGGAFQHFPALRWPDSTRVVVFGQAPTAKIRSKNHSRERVMARTKFHIDFAPGAICD
jgi:hypothetical protein